MSVWIFVKMLAVALLGPLAFTSRVVSAQTETPTQAPTEELDLGLRLLFKFSTDEARNAAAALASAGVLDFFIEEYQVGSITVESLDVLEALLAIDGIDLAEEDSEKVAFPVVRHYENDVEPRRRKIEETIPYGIPMIQADQLWDLEPPAGQVDVCVVDTGIDDGHPDLPNSVTNDVTGTNTFEERPILFGVWDNDGNGHGTHCAGIIGAKGDNDIGVAGVRKNPNTFRFHIGKALANFKGVGSTSTIIEAVHGCAMAGAKVISMSLGGSTESPLENEYYSNLYDEGILIIAAAGNAGSTALSYPASYPVVMSVAAVDSSRNRADFSQVNLQVEIAAPGVNVLSTYPPSTYETLSGTSMATPYVAGVAAEVWSHFPDCTNNQIRNVLTKTALDRGTTGCDPQYGFGIVQGKAAYDLLLADGCEAGGNVTTPLSAGVLGGCGESGAQGSCSSCLADPARQCESECLGSGGHALNILPAIAVGTVGAFVGLYI